MYDDSTRHYTSIDPSLLSTPPERETLACNALLDASPEAAFDDIARLAASCCQTPISLITFVDAHQQRFKASIGIDARTAPLESGFCPLVAASREPLLLP